MEKFIMPEQQSQKQQKAEEMTEEEILKGIVVGTLKVEGGKIIRVAKPEKRGPSARVQEQEAQKKLAEEAGKN